METQACPAADIHHQNQPNFLILFTKVLKSTRLCQFCSLPDHASPISKRSSNRLRFNPTPKIIPPPPKSLLQLIATRSMNIVYPPTWHVFLTQVLPPLRHPYSSPTVSRPNSL
jgi:hypothetical protein